MVATWALEAVRLFVTDIERAKEFYCDRLGMPLKDDGRANGFLLFDFGKIQLVVELIGQGQEHNLVGRYAGLSFAVDNMQTVYEDLKARGVEFMGEPAKQAWGGTTVSFLDPDRNALSFVSGLS